MSNMRPESDPIELLRRSDPVPSNRPSPAQEAQLRARIEEVISMDQVQDRAARPVWRRPAVQGIASLALAAAVVAIAVFARSGGVPAGGIAAPPPGASSVAVVPSATPHATATPPAASANPTPAPSASETTGPISPGGGMAMCIESYDLSTLANRQFAFDGTVTAIDGDEVTFTVNHSYRGETGPGVTLTASGMTGAVITLDGGPVLAVGGRYLVSGDDQFAWACGFTQDFDATVADAWASALK